MNALRATAAALAVFGPLPALAADAQACRDIDDDALRLSCYDRATGRAEPVPAAAATAAAAPAPAPAAAAAASAPRGWFARDSYVPQTFAERWQLDPQPAIDVFTIKRYQPVYVLPLSWRRHVNANPCSPNPRNCAPGAGETSQQAEAKFQLSLKTKLWQDILGSPVDLWAAYTQQSFWQVYDVNNSRPFRETDYQPEAWLTLPLNLGPWRMLNVGVVHQSNGQSDPLSRSWNRVYATFGLAWADFSLLIKPWWRIQESASDDNNPDIADYAGRIELQAVYPWHAHVFSATLRNNLKFGSTAPNRSSLQADWAFPLYGELHGYVQGFYGWGDSLQNYNFRNAGIGVGVSLVEWR